MGLSPTEMIVIVLVALLVFGPRRIAGVGRALGQGIRQFKEGVQGMGDADAEAKPAPAAPPERAEDERS